MHCTFNPRSGRFSIEGPAGSVVVATGYAGHGDGLSNPALEQVRNVGPLPKAVYAIGTPIVHPRLGPNAFPLRRVFGPSFGRSGFFIHGDNATGDFSASTGCIVLPRDTRSAIARLRPTLLIVAE